MRNPAMRMAVSIGMTAVLCGARPAQGAGPARSCAPDAPGAAAVRAVATGIIAADNDRDITRVMGAYAPDAVLLPPGEGPVQGAAAIRRRYESLFAEFSPGIEGRIDEICVSGAIAIVRGHNGGRLSPLGGTPPRELSDSYLMALARGASGKWRITHLIWHRDR